MILSNGTARGGIAEVEPHQPAADGIIFVASRKMQCDAEYNSPEENRSCVAGS
jgi:hypothetical protein